ncbi:MAG: hypothetical protein OES38_00945 [Gammaproteobacteria bacterium]|nr:hypothetical protein [Gammaproteobacteria bacterium]
MSKPTSITTHPRVKSWTSRISAYRRQLRMDRQLRGMFDSLPDGLSEDQIIELWQTWGDDVSPSRVPYIRTSIVEAARASGPILQCGSGLSSLLIGILCHQAEAPGKNLWILEHDPHWGSVIRSWLAQYEITKAHVISAPAEQFDGFVSYVMDTSRMPGNFSLALCEASSALPSSARGIVERMGEHFDHRCVILARNAKRPRDLKYLADWAKSRRAPFLIQDAAEPYAKIALRDQRPDSDHEQERLNTVYGNQATGKPAAAPAAKTS